MCGVVRACGVSVSARYKNLSVRKQRSIVELPSSGDHRPSVGPRGSLTGKIDGLCCCRWVYRAIRLVEPARASTREQDFAVIVHHCRSPIASTVVAIPH